MRLSVILPVVLWLTQALAAPLSEGEMKVALTEKSSVVAFYHIYAAGLNFGGVVNDQVRTIKGSGLMKSLDKVFYATTGAGGNSFTINEPNFIHIAHYGEVGEELQTLSLSYCINTVM